MLIILDRIGCAAQGHGQLTSQEIIEIASMKAKLLSASSKINYKDAAEARGTETPCQCSR